eukprot:CAMPEP_0172449230 /NCGR_PEP_ID=MMETSP1065-20121228/7984_1 /TAXON_ID=265537 /ORGANISM="Amphiprora paludosa, Strain CCMP125" /LENGTH=414 /DNA_ID=CAMNT_0013200855 /DNA_START=64 /DNA_END=1308 /DNA_ORIENTATION=-
MARAFLAGRNLVPLLFLLIDACLAFQPTANPIRNVLTTIHSSPIFKRKGWHHVASDSSSIALLAMRKQYKEENVPKTSSLNLFSWLRSRKIWRRVTRAAVCLIFVFSLQLSAIAAPSGYRTGGSFKSYSRSPSSMQRPSMERIRPAPKYRSYRATPRLYSHHGYGPRGEMRFVDREAVATRVSAGDVAVIAGTGGLIAYGLTSNRQPKFGGENSSLLGAGATSTSLTVAMNVPDRANPSNIFIRLQDIAESVDTKRREGIQELIAETSLELLRNERSITSTHIESKRYPDADKAQRDFNGRSIESRSKFDRETVNRFGGENRGSGPVSPERNEFDSKATVDIIVTLNLAIDGDSTYIPIVKSRADLIDALRRIATDAKVGDCLFSAEVLFSPASANEYLSRKDVYGLYPKLLAI